MLGFKLGLLLVFVGTFSITMFQAYGEGITVTFDKNQYISGDLLSITGNVSEVKMPIIAMSVYDPDGKILSANNIEIDPDGIFTKSFTLSSPFYDKSGTYKLKFDYGKITQNESFSISNTQQPTDDVVVIPEIISLKTNKSQYTDSDTIIVIGTVSKRDSPTVLIGVYDTFGSPAGFYFGNIDSNLHFSTSFLAKAGINFKSDGTYSIKAHYGDSFSSTSFDFFKKINENHDSDNRDLNQNNNTESQTKPSTSTSDSKPSTQNTILEKNNSNTNSYSSSKSTYSESKEQSKKTKNLTIDDIELGIMLNQINLNCDSSKYVDTINYYDGMGPALYRLCKFENSLSFFDKDLTKNPTNTAALVNKGSTLGKLGHYAEAITYYDQALSFDPELISALNNKANVLANLGQYDKAKSLYENALKKNPAYGTARQNLSVLQGELPKSDTVPKSPHQLPELTKIVETQESVIAKIPEISESNSENKTGLLDEIGMAFSSLSSLFGFLK